jgi:hypothetical protein
MTTTTRSPGRQFAELTFPGVSIGLASGAIAGGMALLGGLSPMYAAQTALTLGIPLAAFGLGYYVLLARGRVPLGVATPAVIYWLVLFPVARLLHEVLFDVVSGSRIGLPDALLPFLAFQAMVGVGYGIGFVWLTEHVFPTWWIRIREHNPVAQRYVEQYMAQAATMQPRADRRKP